MHIQNSTDGEGPIYFAGYYSPKKPSDRGLFRCCGVFAAQFETMRGDLRLGLAVMLVPTPRHVPAPTALAQAQPWSRTSAAVWLMMTAAHGRLALPRDSPSGTRQRSASGASSKPGMRAVDRQSTLRCTHQTGMETAWAARPSKRGELNSEGNSFRIAGRNDTKTEIRRVDLPSRSKMALFY